MTAFCCHPVCLTEHIMRNAGLDELQAGIKTGRRNINNLRHVDDTLSLLMRVKEESERASLRLNIKEKKKNRKIMASSPITAWQVEWEKGEAVTDYFIGLQNHYRQGLQP